jgi:hypothetical protein
MRILKHLLLCGFPLGLSMACHADVPPGVPSPGPQVMIYFRQPLGCAGAHRIYGLRLDQGSGFSSSPGAQVGPPRRRELLSFEIGYAADMRVQFAKRLVWDVNRKEFGWNGTHPTLAFRMPPK